MNVIKRCKDKTCFENDLKSSLTFSGWCCCCFEYVLVLCNTWLYVAYKQRFQNKLACTWWSVFVIYVDIIDIHKRLSMNGVVQWLEHSIRNRSFMCSSRITGSFCFVTQETVFLLLSTGWIRMCINVVYSVFFFVKNKVLNVFFLKIYGETLTHTMTVQILFFQKYFK